MKKLENFEIIAKDHDARQKIIDNIVTFGLFACAVTGGIAIGKKIERNNIIDKLEILMAYNDGLFDILKESINKVIEIRSKE